MTQNRRHFIKTAAAVTLITVSKASAQAAPRKIGVVHSTLFDDEARLCLLAGLDSKGWQQQPPSRPKPISLGFKNANAQYGGSYKHTVLRQLIRQHGAVDLIVAAGGGNSQGSAFDELTTGSIPFVYITGRTPLPPSSTDGRYCGIILDISSRYYEALDYFQNQLKIQKKDVWLVLNSNSGDAQEEISGWPYPTKVFAFFSGNVNNPDPRDNSSVTAAFRSEVGKLKTKTPLGIVVSPDPLFRTKATIFKAEMKAPKTGLPSSVPVCYPFKDFQPAAPDFLLPHVVSISNATSTDTNTAYYQAGLLAGAVLDKQTPAQHIPVLPENSHRWDGTTWVTA